MSTEHTERDELRHIRFSGRAANGSLLRRPPAAHAAARATAPDGGQRLSRLAALVLGRAGLDASRYRPDALARRIPACLRALGVHTEQEALDALAGAPDRLDAALGALLIGVSEFFRDPSVFDLLRQLLPDLARATPDGGLRVWSAACANGAELHSVAILLAEAGLLGQCRLLGTDCRPQAVREAQAATYSTRELACMDEALRSRYFRPAGDRWQLVLPGRTRIRWAVQDVLDSPPPGLWDLILCRNLVIYLQPDAAATLWSRLIDQLRPGGLLVVGKAGLPPRSLPLRAEGRCVYRRAAADSLTQEMPA